MNDSVVHIELTGGGGFSYSVRGPGEESPRIWDAEVFSLRPDGKFPSIVLATCPSPSHEKSPVTQQIVYNDNGRLVHKRLGAYPVTNLARLVGVTYPMRSLGLDCAWLESNDLPVCFFASMEDGSLGVSRLIEIDPSAYQQLTSDSMLRSRYSVARKWEGFPRFATDSAELAWVSSAREVAWIRLGVDSATLDRILPDYLRDPDASVSDTLLAALDWRLQTSPRERARAYLLPWRAYLLPWEAAVLDSILAESDVQETDSAVDIVLAVALARLDHEAVFSQDVTREYQLPWPAQYGHAGPNVDGMFMLGAVFLDFSGDGLLDLVVVGQHSRPFSAIQHPDGYFTDAGYHAEPDEYEPVMFWDLNEDGMMDFAARKEDGSWTAFTFVEESV